MPLEQAEKIDIAEGIKHKICFICTGNTCRSPMAAAVYNHINREGDTFAVSFGLYGDGVSPISENAVYALKKAEIEPTEYFDYEKHISKPIDSVELASCEKIYGITNSHTLALISAFPQFAAKITVLPKSIPDPFLGDEAVYCECLDMIISAIKEISPDD